MRARAGRIRLRTKLLVVVLLVQTVTIGLIAATGWQLLDRSAREDAALLEAQIQPLLSAALTPPLVAGDRHAARAIARSALIDNGLSHIEVVSPSGIPLLREPEDTAGDGVDGTQFELTDRNRPLATVRFAVTDRRHASRHGRYFGYMVLAGAVLIMLSAALIALSAIGVTRRLQRLVDAGQQFGTGRMHIRIQDEAKDEIGELARAFNRMAARLSDQFQRLKAKDDRLSLVVQGSSDGIWDWDLMANEVYFSPRFRELLGYHDEAEFRRGFFFSTALHPDDRDRVLAAQYDHLENRSNFDEVYRLRCRDGSYRWFRGRGQARWDGEGKAYRYAGSITDIHAQKLSEAAHRESEERLYYAIRGSSDGIWDWHLKTERYYLSPRFKQLLGYRDDELPNKRSAFLALVHPEDLERIEAQVAHHFKTHEPYDVTYRLRHRDGHYRWFRSRGEAVWDERGQVVRFAGSSGDITEQRRAQESIRALLTEKQAILDNVPVGIAFVEDGQIVAANRRFAELFACEPDDATGRPLTGLLGPAGHDPAGGGQVTREVEIERHDGARRWFFITSQRVNPQRAEDGALWIFADITSLKTTSDALREARELSDAIIRSLPGVFFLLRLPDDIIRWNANLARLAGRDPEQAAAQSLLALFHADDRDTIRGALEQAQAIDQTSVDARLIDPTGRSVPHVFTIVHVELRGVSHLVGIGVDISDRIKAEAEIRALNNALETRVRERTAELTVANKELESFSYSVSHDLSSPLRGIDGFSRMLEEDYAEQLDTTGLGYINRIRAATARMQHLIDDLLKLSRITRDEMHRSDFSLSELATEIGDYLHAESPHRSVHLEIDPDIRIRADRNLMRIVMDNLLRNAWKFTANHPLANLRVGCLHQNGQPVYFVSDDGAGFDMRYADKLFGAFQRLHRDSDFAGTGIGLATVARIIHRHGGRVWAEAEIEKGATFYFTLG
ncbi:PAS domain-containing protein [Nitrogeniibacter mangrovi]|uniref:histidine kinase n=1 Tax=Nitrogeniibacter mangrovi TaxID=2016596 RepID=A0A6C1B339_9RHOO|nr:PAS domain-containing protein [Nitrogeniibacter mangrovi]QID18046.1 PAS domain-containing protein [Nitrogeniibacter mangrovi]